MNENIEGARLRQNKQNIGKLQNSAAAIQDECEQKAVGSGTMRQSTSRGRDWFAPSLEISNVTLERHELGIMLMVFTGLFLAYCE